MPHITRLLNDSFNSGVFPADFKSTIIRPILKKRNLDSECLNNYRPISHLSLFSKAFDKIALSQLLLHLESNKLLNTFQSGYKANHSTETALLRVTEDLLTCFDENEVVISAFLDLSSAFDTVDIPILLSRLQHSFGLSQSALSWFQSYLNDRQQRVLINGTLSQPRQLKYGVPQGSVLGPILFTLYISPISKIIQAHGLSHHCYSDDTQVYGISTTSNIDDLSLQIELCISDLTDCLTCNKLHINTRKTELMLFRHKKFRNHSSLPQSITINDSSVSFSSSVRSLGVIFDEHLTFDKHVSYVCKLAYYELRKLSAIRHLLSTDAAKTLACAFILPRLDYCNSLFASLPKYLIYKLQKVQNHAARLILKVPKRQSASPLLTNLHWLPVRNRIIYKVCSISYAILNNQAPSYLTSTLPAYVPSRDLRSSSQCRILPPKFRMKSGGERSFSHRAANLWNSLPLSLKNSSSHTCFKSHLKTHLFRQSDN